MNGNTALLPQWTNGGTQIPGSPGTDTNTWEPGFIDGDAIINRPESFGLIFIGSYSDANIQQFSF